ncbi:hypothetical protein ACA910_014340 [Epithemia clementina (nom. ined.)]
MEDTEACMDDYDDIPNDPYHHRQHCDQEQSPLVAWTCSVCTFINHYGVELVMMSRTTCSMCGTKQQVLHTKKEASFTITADLMEAGNKEAQENNNYTMTSMNNGTNLTHTLPSLSSTTLSSKSSSFSSVASSFCCPICCEENLPLLSLMKACRKQHQPACYNCLRRFYVLDAQQSVSNYPLRCYQPKCQTPVRETQLINFNLVQNKDELTRYFRFMELAKGHRQTTTTTWSTTHCPHCDHPRTYRTRGGVLRSFSCRHCRTSFVVPETQHLIQAIQNIPRDHIGVNDGWAQCPQCKIVISKGNGCDHMHCLMCQHNFSWAYARARSERFVAKHTIQATAKALPPPST